jgi:citrate lyase subunit beta/citryl-CoA lyase
MNNPIHPSQVHYAGSRPFPVLAACEHFAENEKLLKKKGGGVHS